MKMKAAVCRENNAPIRIEEVELAPPKEKEVLVKTMYTGFCHSDWSAVSGWFGFPVPLVIGHEASGIVEDVGPGVTSVKKRGLCRGHVDDHVRRMSAVHERQGTYLLRQSRPPHQGRPPGRHVETDRP